MIGEKFQGKVNAGKIIASSVIVVFQKSLNEIPEAI